MKKLSFVILKTILVIIATMESFSRAVRFCDFGFTAKKSLVMIDFVPGKDLIHGGAFGMEGSLVSIIALLAVCVI